MPAGGRCCSRPGRWGNPLVGAWAAKYFAFWGLQFYTGLNLPQRARRALNKKEILRRVNERLGIKWHLRTITRDVQILEWAGVVCCGEGLAMWMVPGDLFDQPAEQLGVAKYHALKPRITNRAE